MKPVDQTVFGSPKGNCFAACLASVLELPIDYVPNFVLKQETWFEDACAWAKTAHYTLLWVKRDAVACGYIDPNPLIDAGHYFIVTGQSPRGEFLHCVIEHRGAIVHDPHPSRAGLAGEWQDFIVVIPNVLTK